MMNRVKWVCVVASLCFTANAFSDAEKDADILKLIEASGGMASGEQMAQIFTDQMTQVLRASGTEIPPEVLNVMPEVVMSIVSDHLPELIKLVVPVYGKHFTHDEIREMLAFYESDVGKKLAQKQPQIMAESSQMGQQWGMSVGQEIQRRIVEMLTEKGIDLSGGQ